jgi:hypothetical protein
VRARKKSLVQGVTCWTQEDRQQVAGLVAAFGGDAVQAVAEGIRQNGAEPLPSLVSKSLKGKNHGNPGEHAECDSDALHAAISSSMQYYGIDGGEREVVGEVVGWALRVLGRGAVQVVQVVRYAVRGCRRSVAMIREAREQRQAADQERRQ